MKKLSEGRIIDHIAKTLSIKEKTPLWKDDISAFRMGTTFLAFKCDMFVRSTDAPRQMKVWQMARKSIVSSASDFACKGVEPLASLISLGIPRNFKEKDIQELAKGFRLAEREFHVNIIGGDTNESSDLIIDCCMVGSMNRNKMVKRSGAKEGDLIVTTGPFGYTSAGLKILQKDAKASSTFSKRAKNAVLLPKAKLAFGLELASYLTSAMDSSDGLALTLYEMSEQSKKRFIIERLPTNDDVREFSRINRYEISKIVFQGGEEYEIVATIPGSNLSKINVLAKRKGFKIFVIGYVEKGRGVFMKNEEKLEKVAKSGWEHLT